MISIPVKTPTKLVVSDIGKFFLLIFTTIFFRYYVPAIISNLFFVGILFQYFRSKDQEPFWLAYFLILTDGFFSFFGIVDVLLTIIPGLPAIELTQLYFILALIKARKTPATYTPFYKPLLTVLAVYLGFLLVQGYVLGISLNLKIQFRIVKWLLPFTLYYSIPRLFNHSDKYWRFLHYMFPVAIVALITQIFTLLIGLPPAQFFGAKEAFKLTIVLKKGFVYRGFFSPNSVLISFIGALVALAYKTKHFNENYLFVILFSGLGAAFFSATRGWVLGLVIAFALSTIFTYRFTFKRVLQLAVFSIGAYLLVYTNDTLNRQVNGSLQRLGTVLAFAEGDETAGGTLKRVSERAPPVVNKWKESKLTGWGFSREFLKYQDLHVANQNILLHAGILGAALMILFVLYFLETCVRRGFMLQSYRPEKKALIVFACAFLGYFLIHSTSSQQFAFYATPSNGIKQAFFFSFASLLYYESFLSREDPSND